MAVEEKLLDELRKIRELLEPKEKPIIEKIKPKGFKDRSIRIKMNSWSLLSNTK